MLIYQPVSGYRYNSDSIFLYDFASHFKPKGDLLDIGAGVGVLSLLLSRDYSVQTTIIDKQDIMIEYSKKNFSINDISVNAKIIDISDFDSAEKFDIIISNPPFYDSCVTQSDNEHINISRYNHHMPIETLIQSVKRLLKPRGKFIFCYDAKQIDLLLYHLKEAKLNTETLRFVHSKIDRESKLVMIMARANSKSMTKILAPLIVFDKDGQYTHEAKLAFEKANTNTIKADIQ